MNYILLLCFHFLCFCTSNHSLPTRDKGCLRLRGTQKISLESLNLVQDYFEGMDFYSCLDICATAGLARRGFGVVGLGSLLQFNELRNSTGAKKAGRCFCAKTSSLNPTGIYWAPEAETICQTDCFGWGKRHLSQNSPPMRCGNANDQKTLSLYELYMYETESQETRAETVFKTSRPQAVIRKHKCLKDSTTSPASVSSVQNSKGFFFAMSHNLNSPDYCANLCFHGFGAAFAGLSDTQCFCAFNLDLSLPQLHHSLCSTYCPGLQETSPTCGDGKSKLSVFAHTPGEAPDENGKTTFKACVSVGPIASMEKQEEIREGFNLWGWPYNRQNCWKSCRALKDNEGKYIFNFAGLMAGKICFCAQGHFDSSSGSFKLPSSSIVFEKEGSGDICPDSLDCLSPKGSNENENKNCGGFFLLQTFSEF